MTDNISSYEGRRVETYRGWFITESTHRPASHRFEASKHDGEPSDFARTLDGLKNHLDDIEQE